jgi:transposase
MMMDRDSTPLIDPATTCDASSHTSARMSAPRPRIEVITGVERRRRWSWNQKRPLVEAMHVWLTEQLSRIPGASTLAKAIRYALNHWNGLVLFLEDGRLELDTNTVERAIRPVTITRKNSLFAGNDNGGRHWAIIATLIQSAKLNGVEPLAWLTDTIERIVSGRTKWHELETLLPWHWKAAKEAGTG